MSDSAPSWLAQVAYKIAATLAQVGLQLPGQANGDLARFNSALGRWVVLPPGPVGQVLTSAGPGLPPGWSPGGGGGGGWVNVPGFVQLVNAADQVGIGAAPDPLSGVKLDVTPAGGFQGGRYFLAPGTTRWVWLARVGPYGREEVWITGTASVLRLGACNTDGDAFSRDSEGVVVYAPSGNKLARIKADRFGLTRCTDSALYYFRADGTRVFYSKDPTLPGPDWAPGEVGWWVDRATGFVGVYNAWGAGFPGPAGPERFRVGGDARLDGALRLKAGPQVATGPDEGALFVADGSGGLLAGRLYYAEPGGGPIHLIP